MKGDLLAQKWILLGRWIQAPLAGTWSTWYQAKSVHELFPRTDFHQILFLDGYTLFLAEDNAFAEGFVAKACREGRVGQFTDRYEEIAARYERRHLDLLSAAARTRDEYILELLSSFFEVLSIWAVCCTFPPALENFARKEGLAISDEDILVQVSPFLRTTWLERQSIEIKAIAHSLVQRYELPRTRDDVTALLTDRKFRRAIEKHVSDFQWFGTHHWAGEPYSVEHALDDIYRVIVSGSFVTAADTSRSRPAHAAIQNDLWRSLASFMYWRTHCAEITAKVVFHSRRALVELASEWGMTYDDLLYLTLWEVRSALESGSLVLPENYIERRSGYGTIVENDIERVLVGKELAVAVDAVVPKVDTNVSELRGSVGSKGPLVRGCARVVLEPSQFKDFREGDVLIANETTPDFVPLMKKALAIVTDTGGVTSHAAIVSRELKVPCVVGTKVATKILKDGDLVEVDADSGIVRIIERA